jgi:hypothetical protein
VKISKEVRIIAIDKKTKKGRPKWRVFHGDEYAEDKTQTGTVEETKTPLPKDLEIVPGKTILKAVVLVNMDYNYSFSLRLD